LWKGTVKLLVPCLYPLLFPVLKLCDQDNPPVGDHITGAFATTKEPIQDVTNGSSKKNCILICHQRKPIQFF